MIGGDYRLFRTFGAKKSVENLQDNLRENHFVRGWTEVT